MRRYLCPFLVQRDSVSLAAESLTRCCSSHPPTAEGSCGAILDQGFSHHLRYCPACPELGSAGFGWVNLSGAGPFLRSGGLFNGILESPVWLASFLNHSLRHTGRRFYLYRFALA